MTDKRKVLVLIIWVLLGVAYISLWFQAKNSCCDSRDKDLSLEGGESIVPVLVTKQSLFKDHSRLSGDKLQFYDTGL